MIPALSTLIPKTVTKLLTSQERDSLVEQYYRLINGATTPTNTIGLKRSVIKAIIDTEFETINGAQVSKPYPGQVIDWILKQTDETKKEPAAILAGENAPEVAATQAEDEDEQAKQQRRDNPKFLCYPVAAAVMN